MNILIIPSWYPSESNPLQGSFFKEQALALHRAGHNILILNGCFLDRESPLNLKNLRFSKTQDRGLQVYAKTTPLFGLGRFKPLLCHLFLKRIRNIFNKILLEGQKIDLIHAHSFMPAGYCACKLGNEHDIPVVLTEHSSNVISQSLTKYEVKCLIKCVNQARSFICVGEGLRQSIASLTKTQKTLQIVPNMVSPDFKYKPSVNSGHDFVFLSVGNLIERKRFSMTIQTFARAFHNNKSVKLKIIGDGPMYLPLQKLVVKLGISDQVELTGKKSREDTVRIMCECNAFVLASSHETFGVVYAEALACGKPVIGTRNGGAEWIINDQNGILIDKDNDEQLAHAFLTLYSRYTEFNPKEISNAALEKYSEDAVVRRLNIIYQDCLTPN